MQLFTESQSLAWCKTCINAKMAGLSTADCIRDRRNCMYYSVIRLRIKNPGWDWHLRINLIDLSIFYVTMSTMTELLTYIHILSHAYNPLFFLSSFFSNINTPFSVLTMMPHGFKSSKQDFTFGPWKVTASTNHIMKSKDIERWHVLEIIIWPTNKTVILNVKVLLNQLN